MDVETQTVCVASGAVAARRAAPRGVARLTTYAAGKEILILGPSSAGKTKFTEYLRLGTLDPEGKREMTYQITKSPVFVIRIGPQRGLVLRVRRTVDTPGQVGPVQHASLVGRRKPHAVVVMLDCSKTVPATVGWLRLFCSRLDTVLRKGSYAQRRLREILVILNKRDKIDDAQCDALRQGAKEVLDRHLSVVLGVARVDAIPILECISIQTQRGTVLIDEAMNHLMARLAR